MFELLIPALALLVLVGIRYYTRDSVKYVYMTVHGWGSNCSLYVHCNIRTDQMGRELLSNRQFASSRSLLLHKTVGQFVI